MVGDPRFVEPQLTQFTALPEVRQRFVRDLRRLEFNGDELWQMSYHGQVFVRYTSPRETQVDQTFKGLR